MNKKSYKIFKQDMPRNLSRKQLTSAGVSTTSIVIKGLRIYFLIRVDSVRNATHHYFLDCIEVALAHGGAHTHVDTHTRTRIHKVVHTHTHITNCLRMSLRGRGDHSNCTRDFPNTSWIKALTPMFRGKVAVYNGQKIEGNKRGQSAD